MFLGSQPRSLCTQKLPSLNPCRNCSRCYITALNVSFLVRTRPIAKPREPYFRSSNWHIASQRRGAKKKTTIKLDDLQQGVIASKPLPSQDDLEPEYPPLLQQVRNDMLKFNHCVLLTQVGSFFELYFEHADEYAPLLNLKKTRRKVMKGSSKSAISMAGFPAYQLDRYLKILVQDLNKHVAISRQTRIQDAPTIAKNDLLYTRKVDRIVTPGTLIDEHFMDPWQNNYLLSIHIDPELLSENISPNNNNNGSKFSSYISNPRTEVGLAWIDLSSGDFFTQSTDLASLPSAVARIKPREILLNRLFQGVEKSAIMSILQEDGHIITFQEPVENPPTVKDWMSMLQDVTDGLDISAFAPSEVVAGGSLLDYVKNQLLGSRVQLQAPIRHQAEEYMSIDKSSLRALEIRSTIHDGTYEGSLLHSLKKTVTKSGARLLTQRLSAPSMTLSTINDRLDLVEEMIRHPQLRQNITALLARTFDSLRLVTKFTYGRGDADDLMELAKTITTTNEIRILLNDHVSDRQQVNSDSIESVTETQLTQCIGAISNRFHSKEPLKLAKRIQDSIDEEGLSEYHRLEDEEANEMADLAQDVLGREAGEEDLKAIPKRIQPKPQVLLPTFKSATDGREDVQIMKRNASAALKRLHDALDGMIERKVELEQRLRKELGAESLALKWTPNLAHIAHVKGKDVARVSTVFPKSLSSSKSTRSFQVPEWTQLGAQINNTRFQIRGEEQRVLDELRENVIRDIVKLRRNATVLDELDVACAFANLAIEKNFVRPIVNSGISHNIVGGRHPVVESSLTDQGRLFSPNDCLLGENERIWLITGPNMAGKSTYLRQNALISILAQTGSYVPADYAQIGLVDKIFSRVGSADNLYQDQSTFMVEMLETAQILKEATPRSFVIMDEVGRGTTPEDGIAVSYASLHHLYHVNQCRTLFATHFHTLADMTKGFEKLACYCNDVQEEADGSFSYIHRLKKGVNRDSHALKVARVAGLPEGAIAVAAEVLNQLKAKN